MIGGLMILEGTDALILALALTVLILVHTLA
jgi:hypothetical protein